MRKDTIPR